MSDSSSVIDQPIEATQPGPGQPVCPVCGRLNPGALVSLESLPEELQSLISANAPEGTSKVCQRCVEIFERAKRQMNISGGVFEQSGNALSTPLRLGADERFTGRGVTIAFLDSGFYPHPDLTTPKNRIVAYHSLVDPDGGLESLFQPDVASWHGMMTSVVAAGNGSLSNGFYRGLAPDADVVLIKLAKTGRIRDENILAGLAYVLEHRELHNI